MKRASIVIIGLCILASSIPAAEESADLFGKFLNIKGEVEVLKKDAKERSAVKRGDNINYGDKVWTGKDSRATIFTKSKKVVNLPANSELDTTSGDPQGKLTKSLRMEGLFDKNSSADALVAVAGVRAELEYVLSPRYSAVKTTTPIIRFRELPENFKYQVKITGGGLPSPFKGDLDTNILDLSKVELRKPLERESTYFIQAELVDNRGGLRGKERDVFIRPISEEEFKKITDTETEMARLQKEDPDNPSYQLLLASEYEDMGLYSEALAIYKTLREKYPEDEFIYTQLAHMLNQTKLISDLRKLTEPEK